MSAEERVFAALAAVNIPAYANYYDGSDSEYIVFTIDEYPTAFADNTALEIRYGVRVHYVLPLRQNPAARKAAIRAALEGLGGTSPVCTSAPTDLFQHYVYELDIMEA